MIWNIALGIAIFVFIDAVALPWFSRLVRKGEARLGLEPANGSARAGDEW